MSSGLSRAVATLERWWFPSAPALRLAAIRVLVTGFGLFWLQLCAVSSFALLRAPVERFEPVGPMSLLTAPAPAAMIVGLWLLAVVAGVLALLGWRFRVTGPLFALSLLGVCTYRNSWGMIFHSENLLVMHALILAVLPASDAWSLDARRRRTPVPDSPSPAYGWGLMLMTVITTLTYLIAGVAKLRNAGAPWLGGDVLLAHVAWDNLRKIELGDLHSSLGALLSRFPVAFIPLAWLSMVLELGAPLALLHRRLLRLWALGMWSFHLGVALIMAIVFAYPLSGVAFAPIFAVEEPLQRLAARLRERRPERWLARLLPREDGA